MVFFRFWTWLLNLCATFEDKITENGKELTIVVVAVPMRMVTLNVLIFGTPLYSTTRSQLRI